MWRREGYNIYPYQVTLALQTRKVVSIHYASTRSLSTAYILISSWQRLPLRPVCRFRCFTSTVKFLEKGERLYKILCPCRHARCESQVARKYDVTNPFLVSPAIDWSVLPLVWRSFLVIILQFSEVLCTVNVSKTRKNALLSAFIIFRIFGITRMIFILKYRRVSGPCTYHWLYQ